MTARPARPGGPALRVLSLGAGVQSTTVALLAVEGVLPKPDAAVFADTGWEPAAVYAHLDRLAAVLGGAGIPLIRLQHGDLRGDALDPGHRFVSMPLFTVNPDGSQGMSRRQCTGEYKTKPIRRRIRQLLGYPPPGRVPAGVYAEQWIGFSTDEIHRVDGGKDQPRYVRSTYPLLELGMSRGDCQRWLSARGWAGVPKSACIGCAFHGNRQWREMRDQRPAEWADAVAFDRAIRHGGPRRDAMPAGTLCFLHAARVPLDRAPIDRVSRTEWKGRQVDLLDVLAEQGDPDGCSPYGCRSGVPA